MKLVLAILLCLFALNLSATVIFVDQVTGVDSNDGLTTNTPKKYVYGDPNYTGSSYAFANDLIAVKGPLYANTNNNVSFGGFHTGTATNARIRFVGDYPGWGPGYCTIDGAYGFNVLDTNGAAIVGGVANFTNIWSVKCGGNILNVGGNYETFSGFRFTNFSTYGLVINSVFGTEVTNCIFNNGITNNISHPLYGGYTNLMYGNQEAAINVGGSTNTVVVNCEISFTGQKGVNNYSGGLYPESGLTFTNVTVHDVQDDAFNFSAANFSQILNCHIYTLTNNDNNIGSHSDFWQPLNIPAGSIGIVSGCSISNVVGSGLFWEQDGGVPAVTFDSTLTNSVNIVSGDVYQVCTNTVSTPQALPGETFHYNGVDVPIGGYFTGNGTQGYLSKTNFLYIKRSLGGGMVYFANNVCSFSIGGGVDTYDSIEGVWIFNNTFFTNTQTYIGCDARYYQNMVTNAYYYNNLSFGSTRAAPMFVQPDNANITANVTEHSGFNMYTLDGNFATNGPSGGTTLANWQAYFTNLEAGSFIGQFTYADTGNLRPITSDGASKGTNLTSFLPDLTRIPAQWRVNLAADYSGTNRPASGAWDIGAYQAGTNSPPVITGNTITTTIYLR